MRTIRLVGPALAASVVSLSLFSGCARHVAPQVPETLTATVKGPLRAPAPYAEQAIPLAVGQTELRKPGDFVVHRFSGSFRKVPLRLSERVIAVDGTVMTVDMILSTEAMKAQPGGEFAHLRVTFDRTPGALREVAQVTRVVGEREEPGTLEDYEKLMAETIVVPDRNDDVIGSEIVTADVGGKAIDCKKTSYRVAIGKKSGVMSSCAADGFAWGDVGGEIKTDDGKLVYRAEIVDTGTAANATASASR
ncbi:MAG: hypothetical protein U0235_18990 [Polyangiaceae bacterium]